MFFNYLVRQSMIPFFDSLTLLPEDPILGLNAFFASDPNPSKVNLGIGTYKTAENKSLVLTAITKAESFILSKHLNKEYLPIDGDSEYVKQALNLLFGNQSQALTAGNISGVQTLGGTGALRLGGEFLASKISPIIFIAQQTWPNHALVFSKAGLKVETYPYYDLNTHQFKFDELCNAITEMPKGSAILLQACCHNPTGIDPSFEQWEVLSELIKKQHILPFFDIAYQGFGQDVEADAKPIRYFVEQGHEVLVAYSFSKNFGLYGERVGILAAATHDPLTAKKIISQIKLLIRANYSNPPAQGARIISTVLSSPELTHEWKQELQNMRDRISEMRNALIASLMVRANHIDFTFMHQQIGMFSLCGLDQQQVERLRKEKGIYMPMNGRINIAGLNTQNLDYVADSLVSVMCIAHDSKNGTCPCPTFESRSV